MNDMILAHKVSDIDFYKCYSNQKYQWYQHPIVSDKIIEWSTVKVQYWQDSDSSSAWICNHTARFENSQKGSSLGKRGKINKELKKNERPS